MGPMSLGVGQRGYPLAPAVGSGHNLRCRPIAGRPDSVNQRGLLRIRHP
jgi:hypothetical protein